MDDGGVVAYFDHKICCVIKIKHLLTYTGLCKLSLFILISWEPIICKFVLNSRAWYNDLVLKKMSIGWCAIQGNV